MRKVIAAFLLGLMLSFTCVAAAEDLGLTGTISPQQQVLAVTISPNPVDISSTVGTLVVKDVTFTNAGTVAALIRLASKYDVSFTGLTPVKPSDFNSADKAQADRCSVSFVYDTTAAGKEFHMYYNTTEQKVIAGQSWLDFFGDLFTLGVGESRGTQIKFQSNQNLAGPVSVTGRITFTVQQAQ